MAKETQKPAVTLGGKTYALRFDYGALCDLCDQIGATLNNMQQVMTTLPVSKMHLPLWAGMLDSAPELADPVEGPKAVNALLRKLDIPDAQAVLQTAMEGFGAAMVRQQKGAAANGSESPPAPATDPA